jgi:hypothetical protein
VPRVIAASADIDAPKERVWQIVRDTTRYSEWSPFLVAVEGEIVVGRPVVLVVRMTPGKAPIRQTERVSSLLDGGPEAPSELGWGMEMGAPFFLAANRVQRVIPLGSGRCRYETSDTFRGLLVPVVMGLYGKNIQAGFDETARALKARAEQG